MKTILFYAALDDMSYFDNHSFYANTKRVLIKAGFNVIPSINMKDAWVKDYDGLLCFFYRHGVIPAIFAKIRRKKIFFTGGTDYLDIHYASLKSWLMQVFLFKICKLLADSCLVESHSDLRNMRLVCLFNPRNIHYCPQAMPLEVYESDLTKKSNDFLTICWQERSGNVLRKGVDKALYVFKYLSLLPEFMESKFYILGRNGEGTELLKKMIGELELSERVIITGLVSEEEKIKKLKQCRYFFQLSSYEGFGLAALEAEAAGCIMIHSGMGGLADVCADDGVMINIKDFKYSVESINRSIAERLIAINGDDVSKMIKRIRSTFDEPIRVQNFKELIGSHFLE